MRLPVRSVQILARIAAIAVFSWFSMSLALHVTPAAAQGETVSLKFRTALEPYGSFRHVARWGDVWVPNDVSRDWRPYTVGHWVYSGDYGWYWVSDRDEAEWGWIAFHYGRWVWIDDLGWAWVPGHEWGPAWVDWRRGGGYVGWAPMPPDEVVLDVRDDPQYWIFVRPHDFLAADLETVFVEPEPVILRESVVVNETVVVHDRGFAVNPGIEPVYLSAEIGRPVPEFQVRPRILAGTAHIQDAIQIRAEDLRHADFRRDLVRESNIRETNNLVRPAASVPRPEPLGAHERGRLGQNPPRAASGIAQQAPQPGPNGIMTPGQQRERGATGATPEQQRGLRERGATGPTPEQQRGRGIYDRATPGPAQEHGQQHERRAIGPAPDQERGMQGRGPTFDQRGMHERGATGPMPEQQRGRGLYDRAAPGPAQEHGQRERGAMDPEHGMRENARGPMRGAGPR